MVSTLTPTYDFTQPQVGGDDDAWGTMLNGNWGKVDSLFTSSSRTETGFVGGSPTSLGSAIRIVGSGVPYVEWVETDVSSPAGHYRAEVSGGTWALRANTAVAGDYSTSEVLLTANWTSGLTFQVPVEFVAGPIIHSNTPTLRFDENDLTAPAGQYRFIGSANSFSLQRALTADFAMTDTVWRYSGGGGIFYLDKPTEFAAGPAIVNTTPSLRFDETDQPGSAGEYRFLCSNDIFQLHRALTADFATFDVLWKYDGGGGGGGGGTFTIEKPITFLGGSVISNATPSLRFDETDRTAPDGMFRFVGTGGVFNFERATDPGWASSSPIWSGYASNIFRTYGLTSLAYTHGTVEIGNTTASNLDFLRSTSNNYISIINGANLRVQSSGGTAWASVNGAAGWAAGASDIRLKENVEPIHYGLDTVLALRPIQFDWLEEKRHDIGFSAQDVEKVIPEIVEVWEADPNVEGQIDTYALRKDALTAILVRAVQELHARLEILEGGSHGRA